MPCQWRGCETFLFFERASADGLSAAGCWMEEGGRPGVVRRLIGPTSRLGPRGPRQGTLTRDYARAIREGNGCVHRGFDDHEYVARVEVICVGTGRASVCSAIIKLVITRRRATRPVAYRYSPSTMWKFELLSNFPFSKFRIVGFPKSSHRKSGVSIQW